MRRTSWLVLMGLAGLIACAGLVRVSAQSLLSRHVTLFQTAGQCFACHTGLASASGEDVSFGPHWRASMMANSARDPYWQAGVRRETTDHPTAGHAIEDECSACHMPMARFAARAAGHEGRVFAHLPIGKSGDPMGLLAADGVSCTLCHQITREGLGTRASFTAGFRIDTTTPPEERLIYGPFDIDPGRTRIMRSASAFVPARGDHLHESEVCATCHTLITASLGPKGETIGELPEQVPYLEWQHSNYRQTKSCQACHMPAVAEPMPIAGVLGESRPNVARHAFQGGNFFMSRLLNRYRADLGVEARPEELESAARRIHTHLETEAAALSIQQASVAGGHLTADVVVQNWAGHKLPTAYPSRRAWLRVVVRDRDGRVVFESGGLDASGRIAGNDNDTDAMRFEPHYLEITAPDEVQIYETIMAGPDGRVTTGLLAAVRYVKDNRLLPRGFDKATAAPEVAVHGAAASDADFAAGGDRVRYRVDVGTAVAPLRVQAELWYQPIGARWAMNLGQYQATETSRFVRYWGSMAERSAHLLARASAEVR